jgi:hypothetical protein
MYSVERRIRLSGNIPLTGIDCEKAKVAFAARALLVHVVVDCIIS